MASTYQCIVCKKLNVSMMELHKHHVQSHTLEELSVSVMNLQGLQIQSNSMAIKGKPFSIHNYSGNEEQSHFTQRIKKRGRSRNIDKIDLSEHLKQEFINHNETHCLANCTEFIPWELEWNKSLEVDDGEFFHSIDQLCIDLQSRKLKSRRGRHQAIQSNTELEKMKDITNKLREDNDNSECTETDSQTSLATTSFCHQPQVENKTNHDSKETKLEMYSTLQENMFTFDAISKIFWASRAAESIQEGSTSTMDMDSISYTTCYDTDGWQ